MCSVLRGGVLSTVPTCSDGNYSTEDIINVLVCTVDLPGEFHLQKNTVQTATC